MKLIDIIRISTTNLFGNKTRSALTILGISVGIATIVFLVSLGYGLQDLSLKRIASIEAVNTISVTTGKIASPDANFVKKYQSDARIEKVVIANSAPMQGLFENNRIDGVTNIVAPDFFSLEGLKPELGYFYRSGETKSAVISTGFIKALGKPATDLIGKNLSLSLFLADTKPGLSSSTDIEVRITGIFIDDTTVVAYISPDTIPTLDSLKISQVKIKVRERNEIANVKNEIENNGYGVASVADTIGQLDQVFKIVKIVLAIFGGVALIVALIGMFNTMTIALLERTRDVGIMKATGTDDSKIYLIFLAEAILISGMGGFLGLALGWATTIFINWGVNYLATSVGGEPVDLFSTPMIFIFIMLGFSLLVGVSTGFLPARRASKLNPLEALRYE